MPNDHADIIYSGLEGIGKRRTIGRGSVGVSIKENYFDKHVQFLLKVGTLK